jgi:CRP-like cAMP-binding protein
MADDGGLYQRNLFLASLPQAERAALLPHLGAVDLLEDDTLFREGQHVPYVYFPLTAVLSRLVAMDDGQSIEVASIGWDGVAGASRAIGNFVCVNRTIVLLAGRALRCSADTFQALAVGLPELRRAVLAHELMLEERVQQALACQRVHQNPPRFAGWLLRLSDLGGREVLITQSRIADMLGVPRPGISYMASELQRALVIDYRRGHIRITDRDALEKKACDCYRSVKERNKSLGGMRA